jgi:hypothetical protein
MRDNDLAYRPAVVALSACRGARYLTLSFRCKCLAEAIQDFDRWPKAECPRRSPWKLRAGSLKTFEGSRANPSAERILLYPREFGPHFPLRH